MDSPALALALPPLLIVPAMGLLSRIRSQSPIGRELRRKTLHIGVGLVSLVFPLILTEAWMVVVASGAVVIWMLAVRRIAGLNQRFGCVLHDAGRESHGELYFAVSTAALLLLADGNWPMFAIPLLILTISDAVAAIVGRAWPVGSLAAPARGKTVSGSAAFLLSALIITWSILCHHTELEWLTALAIAGIVACLTCVVEAVSSRGLDNFTVPAIAWLVLDAFLVGV